ncbi:MAG TPA: flagellar M-ring protein FliF, partial [Sulfitobacter sp.]|nr:flagellar M-ring protein FliF [Sulfitobacter sp.]
SIQTISGIKAARVHLVLPERAAFSRSRAEASGSVIVRSQANASMTRSQAQAIQALVASAVADLEAQNVTVLSASGETILAKDEGGSSDFSLQGQRNMIEEQLAQKVESILNARVGPGNARVRVSVDLTTEREVRVSRTFDPAQQVARSIETRVRNSNETDPAAATVDVANNIPDELRDDAGGGAGQSTRSENDEIINYEIGSVQSELVREPGDIERISVAVLVNGSYGTLPDGSEGYIERSPEEMQRLSQLVSTAIGFDQGRGDQVQVDSLQFLDFDSEFSSPAGRGLGAVLADNAMTILRSLFALALVAIIMVLGARPLRMVLDATLPQPALAGAGADAGLLDGPEQNNAPKALTGGTQNETPPNRLPTPAGVQTGAVLGPMDEMPRDMVQLASVEGAVQHSQLRAVAELAEDNTEDALRVLGQWLSEGDDL